MSDSSPNPENTGIPVVVYNRDVNHLREIIRLKEETMFLYKERISNLENELKNLAREKFVFLN